MSVSIERSTTIVWVEEHLASDVGNHETVVLDTDRLQYFGLNSVASRVRELTQSPTTVDDICKALVNEFEVDRNTCETQVLDLVRDLRQESLIRVVGSSDR